MSPPRRGGSGGSGGTGGTGEYRSRPGKEQRRTEILDAAKRVFAAKGFHASKVSDVAAAAGVSHGSVYWYFDSKEALFHALMEEQERALRRHIDRALEGPAPAGVGAGGEARFRRSVQATFEFFDSDRDTVKLLFRDPLVLGDRFDRHLGAIYQGFIDDLEKAIAEAQRAGRLLDAPSRIVAYSIASLISGLALRRLSDDDGMPAADVAHLVVTMLLDGLKPRR